MLGLAAHDFAVGESFTEMDDALDVGFTFAFQPIHDLKGSTVEAHEALVRGCNGESAASVIAAIRPQNQYRFDQACRVRAIADAAHHGIEGRLHLNCGQITPETIHQAIRETRQAAVAHGIEPGRIVLEFSSLEKLGDPRQLDQAREIAHRAGFRVLADNIGVGEVGLKRIAVFKPDYVKLDRSLLRGIDKSLRRQAIVFGLVATARMLGATVIANGVERIEELRWLQAAGITHAQGYLLGKPAVPKSDLRPLAV
ncbi:MAG: EAL domain-containing protein [Wenzhouxiangellaceae bacterium]